MLGIPGFSFQLGRTSTRLPPHLLHLPSGDRQDLEHFATFALVLTVVRDAFEVAHPVDLAPPQNLLALAFGDLAEPRGGHFEIEPPIAINTEKACALAVRGLGVCPGR